MDRLLETLPGPSGGSKGDNGRVGVIGGGVDYPGQPTLTGLAALRTGSDVVKALVAAEIHSAVAAHSPNLLVARYPDERFDGEAVDRAVELADWADALVVGPGLADADPAAVRRLLADIDVPVVVDALAIGPTLEDDADFDFSNAVFTPDGAETERIRDSRGSVEAFSKETGAVVVETGEVDTIVSGDDRTENSTGSAALTVAGTGDTLAGIVGSLLGQGLEPAEAAELGAWILGKSGELATTEKGNGVVATDVIEQIPDTIR